MKWRLCSRVAESGSHVSGTHYVRRSAEDGNVISTAIVPLFFFREAVDVRDMTKGRESLDPARQHVVVDVLHGCRLWAGH